MVFCHCHFDIYTELSHVFFFPPCTYRLHYPLFNLPEPWALHQQFERNKLCLIFLIGVLWKSNNMKYVWQNCVNGTHTHSVKIFMLTCEIKSKKQQPNSPYFAWNFDSNMLSVIFHNDFTNREARAHTLCVGAKISLISRHPRLTCHFL